jgi:nucleoid-associated protein YgaU
MGKLERARIYVLPGNGEGKQGDAESAIDVCFNPKEYALDKQVGWDAETAFSDAPNPEFKQPSPMTLSVTLQFDSYEERVSVRDKWVRQIEKLTLMKKPLNKDSSAQDKKDNRPPTILFVWGRFVFKGVIESLSQKYTMFLSDGTPVRAECALKIRNVLDQHVDAGTDQSFKKDTSQGRTYTVKDGDRLDLIAARELGDAGRWSEIAAYNDITDPAKLIGPDGQSPLKKLQLPEE